MELFEQTGHLTDEALAALISGEMDELSRLEISEHLSYCDRCLDRYLAGLTDDKLELPAHSCCLPLTKRIRQSAVHALSSRYATAAAAVAIVVALWSGGGIGALVSLPAKLTSIPVSVTQSITENRNAAQDFFSGFNGISGKKANQQTTFGGK